MDVLLPYVSTKGTSISYGEIVVQPGEPKVFT
jgi:hypothetical protein